MFLVVYIKGKETRSLERIYTMTPLHIQVTDIKYRRPGLTKISFTATYSGYTRRGVVVYDTVAHKFITHTRDIEVLAAICVGLQRPATHTIGLA